MCRALWTEQSVSYESPELSFDGIHQMPKPLQAGGVPLWISGTVNKAVARRIARFGSGWIPWGPALADLPGSIAAMKDAVLEAGGDPTGLQVQGSTRVVKKEGGVDVAATLEPVPGLAAAGVTDFRLPLRVPADYDGAVAELTEFVDAFRDATR